MKRVVIVTDAWAPQVNGVVRTLEATVRELGRMGYETMVISPADARTVPCPTYPEIRLALTTPSALGRRIAAFGADAIHIATEGPLGLAARRWCLTQGLPFTTAYHTQFPDYLAARTGISPALFWRYVRWFHRPAAAVLASTPTIERTLAEHGLPHAWRWGRGVDGALFNPAAVPDAAIRALPGPVMLYVGRLAVEKNLAAFLDAPVAGSKVVVGEGPARAALERQFPDAHFLGHRGGAALAAAYAAADVFVFPSRTDTFGMVLIEALACGTPVAAYPVTGPIDVLAPGVGAMDEDLARAIDQALSCDRAACAAYGAEFTWARSARQFLSALRPIHPEAQAA